MLTLGLKNGHFFAEYTTVNRPIGNIKEECDLRAIDLAKDNDKFMLGMSSGLDSQIIYLSFVKQNIPIECAFLYLPGYNEFEYKNLRILEKAWGFKAHIVDIDPDKVKDEILHSSAELNIHPNQILQRKFLSQLPDDYAFLQGWDGPLIVFNDKKPFYYEGYNSFEVSRNRAFNSLNRKGKNILYDRTTECILSMLQDDIMKGYVKSAEYFEGNGLTKDGYPISIVDRWDYYVKPIMYAKYWGDDLFYFPKYAGPEGIDYIESAPKHKFREQYITVNYEQFIQDLHNQETDIVRYYDKQRPSGNWVD
jgi:hypothetical protein